MKKRKKINKSRVATRRDTIKSLEGLLKQLVPDFSIRLGQAERRAAVAEEALATLRKRMIQLLSPDQVEAARICGCPLKFMLLSALKSGRKRFFLRSHIILDHCVVYRRSK